MYLIIIGI